MTPLTLCSTPIGIGIIDTLVLSVFDDLADRNEVFVIIAILAIIDSLRFDDCADLVLNASRHRNHRHPRPQRPRRSQTCPMGPSNPRIVEFIDSPEIR
jgi:hypothetical protein